MAVDADEDAPRIETNDEADAEPAGSSRPGRGRLGLLRRWRRREAPRAERLMRVGIIDPTLT